MYYIYLSYERRDTYEHSCPETVLLCGRDRERHEGGSPAQYQPAGSDQPDQEIREGSGAAPVQSKRTGSFAYSLWDRAG
ncbi:hypothetical protein D3C75_1115250 [compost metagenome]